MTLRSSFLTRPWLRKVVSPWLGWSFAVALGLWWLAGGGAGQWVQQTLWHPWVFSARSALGLDPAWDSRLVVYALGDSSLGLLKDPEPSLADWGDVLEALDRAGAENVFIDKIFAFTRDENEAKRFAARIKKLSRVPITGAFLSPRAIPHRTPVPAEHEALSARWLEGWSGEADSARASVVYGPAPSLLGVLTRFGHLNYEKGWVTPLTGLDATHALPHALLRLSANWKHEGGSLTSAGKRVPLSASGKVLVNLPSPKKIGALPGTFAELLEKARSKAPLDLPKGSQVLLLTTYYSGGGQSVLTPFGMRPSAEVNMALANSVLSGLWIRPLSASFWILFPAAALAVFAGLALRLSRASAAIAGGSLAAVAAGFAAFCYGATDVPGLWYAAAVLFGGGIPLWTRALEVSRDARSLKESLEGLLPDDKIQNMVLSGAASLREPNSRILSIVFIDIVGFSACSESGSPKEVFAYLKLLMGELTDAVHRWGGVVDKTLGDGLLCFFGVAPDGGLQPDHADRAVKCALDIQKQSLERLSKDSGNDPVLPYRVGVYTASVLVGDVGTRRRLDLTVLGHGVNLAKRMETAADPFTVLIGMTTASLLQDVDVKKLGGRERWIPLKHMSEPVKACELAPEGTEEARRIAEQRYRTYRKLERSEARIPLMGAKLEADCGWYGKGGLVNFSRQGLCVLLPRYLARGLVVPCQIALPNGSLLSVMAEVRWASPAENGKYYCGLSIQSSSDQQKEAFYRALSPYEKVQKSA